MRVEPAEPGARPGVIVGAVALVGAGVALAGARLGWWPECRFRAATGLPCPTCGSTRLLEALWAGDPAAAARANPAVFAGLVLVAAWAALSLAGRKLVLTGIERRRLGVFAAAAAAAGWAYALWSGGG